MTTTTAAIATRDNGPGALIARYEKDFATVLPAHIKPETFVRLAQGALRRDPKLAEAANENAGSLLVALLEAARLGLEPGTPEFYLTPRRVKGKNEILGIVGYRGEIELIYRAGAASSVVVQSVYSGDEFAYNPGEHERPVHRVDWFGNRGELLGAYAYAVMKDGATSRVCVIGPKDIADAKSGSMGADQPWSPWQKFPEQMAMKTAVHRLAKFVPTSAEFLAERLRAAAEATRIVDASPEPLPPVDVETGEIVEAEVIEP